MYTYNTPLPLSLRLLLPPAAGTTGDPKGVMIPHRAVVSTIAGILAFLDFCKEKMGPSDSYLSYLPLAHIFDRCAATGRAPAQPVGDIEGYRRLLRRWRSSVSASDWIA